MMSGRWLSPTSRCKVPAGAASLDVESAQQGVVRVVEKSRSEAEIAIMFYTGLRLLNFDRCYFTA
jgi:hypothetical protein